jgi:hypothetical protein
VVYLGIIRVEECLVADCGELGEGSKEGSKETPPV